MFKSGRLIALLAVGLGVTAATGCVRRETIREREVPVREREVEVREVPRETERIEIERR